MTTEVKIKTTQTCPKCNGEKEISNPEYIEMGTQYDLWKQRLGRWPTPKEDNDWQNNYWRSKGYHWDETETFVIGPWDVARCNNCEGTGTETRTRFVGLVELSKMMKEAFEAANNAYVAPEPIK